MPARSLASFRLFEKVRQGDEQLLMSESIFSEICYVLSSNRQYRASHQSIHTSLSSLLTLPGLNPQSRALQMRALDIFRDNPRLDIEDALSLAHMERAGINEIWSYDRDFDSVPGIRRLEP